MCPPPKAVEVTTQGKRTPLPLLWLLNFLSSWLLLCLKTLGNFLTTVPSSWRLLSSSMRSLWSELFTRAVPACVPVLTAVVIAAVLRLCCATSSLHPPRHGWGHCTVQGPPQWSPKLTEVSICCWRAWSCPTIKSLLLLTCLDGWYLYFGRCVNTESVWFWMPVITRNFEHECSLLSLVKCYRWEVPIWELVSECCKLNFLVLLIAWAFIIVIYLLLKGYSVFF